MVCRARFVVVSQCQSVDMFCLLARLAHRTPSEPGMSWTKRPLRHRCLAHSAPRRPRPWAGTRMGQPSHGPRPRSRAATGSWPMPPVRHGQRSCGSPGRRAPCTARCPSGAHAVAREGQAVARGCRIEGDLTCCLLLVVMFPADPPPNPPVAVDPMHPFANLHSLALIQVLHSIKPLLAPPICNPLPSD